MSAVAVHTHHCRGRDVDDGDGARSDVIDQLAQDGAVRQSLAQILRQRHLQPGLQSLQSHSGLVYKNAQILDQLHTNVHKCEELQ